MSIIGSNILAGAAGSGVSAYEIEQSLRFNVADGHYLNRTPSTDGNRRTFTYSGWHKFVGMPDASNNRRIFGARSANTDSGWFSFHMRPDTDNRLEIQLWNHSVNVDNRIRDFSAWYHLVLAVDTTQATATDRVKVYINGVQATYTNNSGSGISGFSQNLELAVNDNASVHNIGTFNNATSSDNIMPMYAAEIYFVDGTQLDETSFGEFDDNGVWRPINVSGLTYGTNGFHLDFSNSSNLGEDQAGSNDWTANSFTTSGTGTDVMSDTPTTNWCVMNPNDNGTSNITLSNGNLSFAAVTTWDRGVKGTFAVSSGKWYWEYTHGTIVSSSQPGADLGITKYTSIINSHPNGGATSTDSYILAAHDGELHNGSYTGSSYGSAAASGDVISIALDLDNGRIWWAKNGTWFNSGNPASGTNAGYTGLSGTFFPLWYWGISPGTGGVNLAPGFNFGQFDFEYTPPTDFLPLNTSNLPAPDIADGSEYFNTVLYTGNGSTQSITGVGFQPDWIWCKTRDSSSKNTLTDAVRGADRQLWTDLTTAEQTNSTQFITSFDSDGFTSGPSSSGTGSTNENNGSFVAWNWLAGNGTSSNTSGSITSTVSANPTAGFSIVTYTGNATSGETVGHGLGIKPKWLIVRQRDNTSHWAVYTETEGAGRHLLLNSTNAAANSSAGYYFTAEPTSTVFTVGSNGNVNANGGDMLAYCFAEVEGYSKFGSYTGNGSSDGPFVFCNFKPAVVLTKCSSNSGDDWRIWDNQRPGYNLTNLSLAPNTSAQEDTSTNNYAIDILSNGFKLRSLTTGTNGSGRTYVFMALAENPFGGSGVSPATAR